MVLDLSHYTFSSFFLFVNLFANELPENSKELDYVVYGELDYLFWFSNQNGLHSPTVATGKSPNLNSKWSPGFRATIGEQSSCWNTELCYTHFSTSSDAKANANIETILTSTPSTAGIFEVGEKWNLYLNRLDLQISRKILCYPNFILEPFFGLVGFDVSQKFDLNVNTFFLDLTTNLPATNIVNSKNRNSLLGIGPRAGFKTCINFESGFSLYGNFGANILWSRFKIKQKYNQTDYYSSSNSTLIDQDNHISQDDAILNTDLQIGFNWRYLCQQSNLEIIVNVGWEHHYYIDIVRFQDFYLQQTSLGSAAYATNGNLSLSGLTFGILIRY